MQKGFRTVSIAQTDTIEQQSYSQWEESLALCEDAFTARKETVRLSRLVEKAIAQELSQAEQKAIYGLYYDRLSPVELAEKLGISRTSVLHTAARAEKKLERVLQYVMEYQQQLQDVPFLSLSVRKAITACANRRFRCCHPGERIRAARCSEDISLSALACGTEIPTLRLEAIESGEALPDASELLRLSTFLNISTDQILKGVKHEDITRTGAGI